MAEPTQAPPLPGPPARARALQQRLDALRARLECYVLFRVLASTVAGYNKDRLPQQAAALTYFGIFSLFPLVLLFMSLAGLALQSSETAREQIMALIVGLLPQGQEELRRVIVDVIEAKGTAAGIGLVTLLWSALGWFQVIDDSVNAIWGVSKPRSFLKSKLFALAMVAAVGLVALASFAATAAIELLADFTGLIPGSAVFWHAAVSAVSVLAIGVVFYLLYRYTPRRDVQCADVWPAALVAALAWEATRRGLALYLEHTDLISGYGPIGAMMALLLWLYVASTLVLVGAELSYAIAKERRHLEAAAPS